MASSFSLVEFHQVLVCHRQSDSSLSFRARGRSLICPAAVERPSSTAFSTPLVRSSHAAQKNLRHLPGQFVGAGIYPRVIPGVNPIHHSKQTQDGHAGGKSEFSRLFEFVDQADANAIILPL